jgi:hypothetical protein
MLPQATWLVELSKISWLTEPGATIAGLSTETLL